MDEIIKISLMQANAYTLEKSKYFKKDEAKKKFADMQTEMFFFFLNLNNKILDFTSAKVEKDFLENKEPKTKECPKCKEQMPFNYKYHIKCGWRGE